MDSAVSVAPSLVGQPVIALRVTRRQLVKTGTTAAAALALGDAIGLARRVGLAETGWRRSEYAGQVGRRFRLTAPGAAGLSIPLVAVSDLRAPRGLAGSEDAFVLIFQAPAGSRRLGQAVMEVRHPDGWSQRLLVSPASPGGNGLDYQAVINRARP